MLAADSNAGHNRQSTRPKSGYEPSDTETEWHDSPWNDAILKSQRTRLPKDPARDPQVGTRRQNTSPNRVRDYPDEKTSSLRNNRTPPRVTEQRRHTSPYAGGNNESRKKSSRTPPRFRPSMEKFSRSSIKERISRSRSISTPKLRPHEKEHPSRVPAFRGTPVSTQVERDSIDVMKGASHAENCSPEINELVANSKGPSSKHNEYTCTSTESAGDIFFSRDCRAPLAKTLVKNNSIDKSFTSDSNVDDADVTQANSNNLGRTSQFVSVRTGFSRTTNTIYANGRHSQVSSGTTLSRRLNSDRFSGDSGKFSDFTGKLVGGVMKFTSSRQKTQNDAWFPCVIGKSCRKPEPTNHKTNDDSESTFIRKALVVEKIRLFWADKYRPRTLNGFTCHREQVQQLKQLISPEFCPHIILKGPPGSGKRSLCRAVLTEIFGDSSLNVSHYLKSCNAQGPASAPIFVPLSSSDHHVELNMRSQSKNARYALTALANEMSSKHKITEISATKNFKVIVLYDVDKVSENNQRLIKWIIDSSSDSCKIIMTCQDGPHLLDSITNRCKLISIGVPNTREINNLGANAGHFAAISSKPGDWCNQVYHINFMEEKITIV
uniref:Replication factor C subunit 3 n=1 Tax=Aegilops tauschii subsp. strangulata TaxID=200361 RepID=A0A453PD01_AEGTS